MQNFCTIEKPQTGQRVLTNCRDVYEELESSEVIDRCDPMPRVLQLAIKACVDSFWAEWRAPDSVKALLDAGASLDGVETPTGYDDVDALLRQRGTERAEPRTAID